MRDNEDMLVSEAALAYLRSRSADFRSSGACYAKVDLGGRIEQQNYGSRLISMSRKKEVGDKKMILVRYWPVR